MNDSNEDLQGEIDGWDGEDDAEDNASADEDGEHGEHEDAGAASSGEEGAGPARRRRRRRRRGDSRDGRAERAEPLPEDERTRQAVTFVADVVREMGMDCRVRLRRPRPNGSEPSDEIVIEIYGKDAGRIIGKKGQVLSALQFLVHRAVNRPGQERRHILVDAEGYRSRRDDSLASMARRLGKQAVDEGKIITFEPMNPRDRRVVHLALAKFEGVITKSDGEGDERRVQIIPVRRSAT